MKKFLLLNCILLQALFVCLATKTTHAQTYNMSSGIITTCTGTFYDSGGSAANYNNNENKTMTFCSSNPAQSIIFTFTSFSLDANFDFLYVYNGPNTGSPLLGTYSTTSPGVLYSTPGGCLTFKFTSDASVTASGWAANISCGTPPNQDCIYKKALCGTTTLNDNNGGSGVVADLTVSNEGCLNQGEHQSSWYSFTIGTSGTFDFLINPASSCDDYDFGLWGPNPACPPTAAPTRCSVACHSCTNTCGTLGNNGTATAQTGLSNTATATSEASGSTVGYVKELNVVAGETYILMVDNSQTNGANGGFTMTFGGSATLTNCPTLPVELLDFTASAEKTNVRLEWRTASEVNSAYYQVERSVDGIVFEPVGNTVKAAGNSISLRLYTMFDQQPLFGTVYYRLKQVDIDGKTRLSELQIVKSNVETLRIVNIYPNPITQGLSNADVEIISDVKGLKINLLLKDAVGKTLYNVAQQMDAGYNKLSIPLSLLSLQSGMYFLQITSAFGTASYKIVVQ